MLSFFLRKVILSFPKTHSMSLPSGKDRILLESCDAVLSYFKDPNPCSVQHSHWPSSGPHTLTPRWGSVLNSWLSSTGNPTPLSAPKVSKTNTVSPSTKQFQKLKQAITYVKFIILLEGQDIPKPLCPTYVSLRIIPNSDSVWGL